jgi:polysaccharide export outer membrane protein
LAALGAACALAACALPASGPYNAAIRASATVSLPEGASPPLKYALVDVTADVLAFATDPGPSSLVRSFGKGRGKAPEILVGIGDRVQVSIFESGTGGLFIPVDAGARPGNFVTLPEQTVDNRGLITVPYAGQIPANGRPLSEVQQEIERRLANRALEPQVVVSVVNQRATEVAVIGEVNTPNKFAINPAGDTVLDMISRAGGTRFPGYDMFVTLQRGNRTTTVHFSLLTRRPDENIYVAPGDTIYVFREQRTFLAYGASGQNGQFNFDAERLSLAEGVAKAGGLLDGQADPSHVFLYRIEQRSLLEKMGVDISMFDPSVSVVPTIYRTNLRNPTSLFLAQTFPLRNKDLIYISNADSVELIKFLAVINAVSGTVGGVAGDALVTRELIRGPRHE